MNAIEDICCKLSNKALTLIIAQHKLYDILSAQFATGIDVKITSEQISQVETHLKTTYAEFALICKK